MAKRKPVRAKAAKAAAKKSPARAGARGSKAVRKVAAKKGAKKSVAKKAVAKKAKKATKVAAKRVAAKRVIRRIAAKRAARKAAPKRTAAKKVVARKTAAKAPVKVATKTKRAPKPAVTTKRLTQAALPLPKAAAAAPKPKQSKAPDTRPKHPPTLDRARKTIAAPSMDSESSRTRSRDEAAEPHDIPSSLDVDRTASSARSGRIEMRERLKTHGPASPAITAGDVDADWESAESVGDEAPGGDNPTPDQDVVDDIGRALGVEYDDDEELKGGDEITARDKHRWELDPGSSDDFEDR